MSEKHLCELCGEPMPEGEEMFNYHGYSCNCPKSSLEKTIEKGVKEYMEKVGSVDHKDIVEHDFREGIKWALEQQAIQVEMQSINFTDIEKIFEGLKVKEFLEYQKAEQRNVVRFIAYSDGYRKALNDFMKEIKSKIAISNED